MALDTQLRQTSRAVLVGLLESGSWERSPRGNVPSGLVPLEQGPPGRDLVTVTLDPQNATHTQPDPEGYWGLILNFKLHEVSCVQKWWVYQDCGKSGVGTCSRESRFTGSDTQHLCCPKNSTKVLRSLGKGKEWSHPAGHLEWSWKMQHLSWAL